MYTAIYGFFYTRDLGHSKWTDFWIECTKTLFRKFGEIAKSETFQKQFTPLKCRGKDLHWQLTTVIRMVYHYTSQWKILTDVTNVTWKILKFVIAYLPDGNMCVTLLHVINLLEKHSYQKWIHNEYTSLTNRKFQSLPTRRGLSPSVEFVEKHSSGWLLEFTMAFW